MHEVLFLYFFCLPITFYSTGSLKVIYLWNMYDPDVTSDIYHTAQLSRESRDFPLQNKDLFLFIDTFICSSQSLFF